MTGDDQTVIFHVVDEVVHLLDTPGEPWSIELELAPAGRLDEARGRPSGPRRSTILIVTPPSTICW